MENGFDPVNAVALLGDTQECTQASEGRKHRVRPSFPPSGWRHAAEAIGPQPNVAPSMDWRD